MTLVPKVKVMGLKKGTARDAGRGIRSIVVSRVQGGGATMLLKADEFFDTISTGLSGHLVTIHT